METLRYREERIVNVGSKWDIVRGGDAQKFDNMNLFNARDWFWKSGFIVWMTSSPHPISWTTDDNFFGFGEVDK